MIHPLRRNAALGFGRPRRSLASHSIERHQLALRRAARWPLTPPHLLAHPKHRMAFSKVDSFDKSPSQRQPPSNKMNVYSKFVRMQSRLLGIPMDNITTQDWSEAKNTMYFWISKLSEDPLRKDNEALVDNCFELLDRLVQESKAPPADIFEDSVDHVLNQIINKWRFAWKGNSTKRTPLQILEKVDSYVQHCWWISTDSRTFDMILDGAGYSYGRDHPNWSRDKAALFAQKLLERMVENPCLDTSSASFASVMHVWARSGLEEAPHRADKLLRQVEQLANVQINNDMYCTVIDAWARSLHPRGLQRAQALLEEMEQSSAPGLFPDTTAMCHLLSGLAARAKEGDNADRSLGLLKAMIHSYQQDKDSLVKPNQSCFVNVLRALGGNNQAEKAESLLEDMHALYQRTQDPDFCPDRRCYTAVVDAWSKQGEPVKAQALIDKMLDLAETTGDTSFLPTKLAMNSLIHAHAKQHKLKQLGRRTEGNLVGIATSILKYMERIAKEENRIDMQPDVYTYGAVIDCIAMSNHGNAGDLCQDVMRRMEKKARETADPSLRPNGTIYNTVINAYARTKSTSSPQRAVELLLEMRSMAIRDPSLKPDRHTYVALMTAWARSTHKHAMRNVQTVFDWLCEDYTPQDVDYRAMLNAWASKGNVKQVASTLDVVVKSYFDRQNHLRRCEEQGLPIDPKYKEPVMVPCTKIFNLLLTAYAKSDREVPNKGMLAESTFLRMQKLHEFKAVPTAPDTISLGAVLLAWTKSPKKDAMKRAEAIFQKCLESNNPNLKPNIICVNTILDGYAKMYYKHRTKTRHAARLADSFLMNMWDRHDQKLDDPPIRPDKISYTSVMSAWGHSRSIDCGEQAQRLLDDMIDRLAQGEARGEDWSDLQPDSMVYSTVIKAWQHQADHEEANQREIRSRIDHLYATMKREHKRGGHQPLGQAVLERSDPDAKSE